MQAFSEVFPHLVTAADVPKLVKIDDVDFAGVDAVFCCLPHATTQNIIKSLPEHLKIVDLSADFRLADVNTYAEWCAARVAAGWTNTMHVPYSSDQCWFCLRMSLSHVLL
jgi:N-acetyl-gamma-glutamyl-phosphate reductase